ncbi:anthranilate phosphoribosyltransferase, partial [Halobacteriales archaeon SW_12_67_38]
AGGTPVENARDLEGIVAGEIEGAKRDIVLANAGAAIHIGGAADSLTEGVERAREAIDSGDADEKLAALRTVDEAVAGETA